MSDFCTIEEAIVELKNHRPLVVVDDPDRENQGDLFFPAEVVDTHKINLMIQEARGLICVPITQEYAARLDLWPMLEPGVNSEATRVNFTVSVDAYNVTAFGISASDRAKTIKTIIDKTAQTTDLVRPGHVFPLLARSGGVLERAGHTEAASELAELAGFAPCGVICEILNTTGQPSEGAELLDFAKQHGLKLVTIAELVKYRRAHPRPYVKQAVMTSNIASSVLPTTYGKFQMMVYKSVLDNREHSALLLNNEPRSEEPMLTRVHSQCLTGDTFSSLRCDCQAQLQQSLAMIQDKGRGIVIYLAQEGRGIGLGNKIKAYALQDKGYDTAEANRQLNFPVDARSYKVAADILNDLDITTIDLLTNNPDKQAQLMSFGITVHQTLPLEVSPNPFNTTYLSTKKHTLGHHLSHL